MSGAKKKATCLCATKFCRNRAAKGRRVCYKCKQREFRKTHPIAAALANLRAHAKQRGIQVLLTLKEWTEFVLTNGLFDASGNRMGTLTVDRKDATLPYTRSNLQVLTHSENVIKGNRERHTKYYQQNRWRFAGTEPIIPEVVPTDPDEPLF